MKAFDGPARCIFAGSPTIVGRKAGNRLPPCPSAHLVLFIFGADLSATSSIQRLHCSLLPWFRNSPVAPRHPRENLATLIAVSVGIATFVHSLIVLLAGGLQAFLAAPQRREIAGNGFAAVLFLVAVWLFVSGSR
jgi:hypothetical protein